MIIKIQQLIAIIMIPIASCPKASLSLGEIILQTNFKIILFTL